MLPENIEICRSELSEASEQGRDFDFFSAN